MDGVGEVIDGLIEERDDFAGHVVEFGASAAGFAQQRERRLQAVLAGVLMLSWGITCC